jgi:serine/threonine protein kinase
MLICLIINISMSIIYKKIEKIGEGAYGNVYKVVRNIDGKTYAMKCMYRKNVNVDDSNDDGNYDENTVNTSSTINEISILKILFHPNIIKLYDVFYNDIDKVDHISLILEYCDYDLNKYIKYKNYDLRPAKIQNVMYQILCGIKYIHDNSIVHRDIKPQNILVKNGCVKIADFGLAFNADIPVKKYSHPAATLYYRPPDVILGSCTYGYSIDMWSAGCIMAEMVIGTPLFCGKTEAEQLDLIFEVLGIPSDEDLKKIEKLPQYTKDFFSKYNSKQYNINNEFTWKKSIMNNEIFIKKLGQDGIDLLWSMLQYDPSKRISASDAILHPYFRNYK